MFIIPISRKNRGFKQLITMLKPTVSDVKIRWKNVYKNIDKKLLKFIHIN